MAIPSLIIISILDFLAAILIFLGSASSIFLLSVAMLLLVKGVWTIFSSISSGFYFEVLGAIDFIAALVLVVIYFGGSAPFFWVIGLILLAKAIYTVLRSI